jgi:hypothetical protein
MHSNLLHAGSSPVLSNELLDLLGSEPVLYLALSSELWMCPPPQQER